MYGSFSEESLAEFIKLTYGDEAENFSEEDFFSFTRCVRPNGSTYGTAGRCKKGTETSAKEVAPSSSRTRPKAAIESDMQQLTSSGAMQQAGIAGIKARAKHAALKAELKKPLKDNVIGNPTPAQRAAMENKIALTRNKNIQADRAALTKKIAKEMGKDPRDLDVSREVAKREKEMADKREANKRQLEADKYKPTQTDKESALKAVRDEAAKRAAAGDDKGVDAAIKAYNNIKKGDTKEEKANSVRLNEVTKEITTLQSMADKAREDGFMDRAVDLGKRAGKLIRERADLKTKIERAKSPADLATPQRQGKADVDRIRDYAKDEAAKLKALNDTQKQNPNNANDPAVASRKKILERNVAATEKQLKELEEKR